MRDFPLVDQKQNHFPLRNRLYNQDNHCLEGTSAVTLEGRKEGGKEEKRKKKEGEEG